MANRLFLLPEAVRGLLITRYRNQHQRWLAGDGSWPLLVTLGCPSEDDARQQPDTLRMWVKAWEKSRNVGEVTWCERRWRSLGTQRLPERLVLSTPEEVAAWLGEEERWRRAVARFRELTSRWPSLVHRLPRYFNALADYGESDYLRVSDMLAWLEANPRSNLYPRQLPVGGLDSKWLEERKSLIADLLAALRPYSSDGSDFYARCGLKPLPAIVRLRVLDPTLRELFGGLGDIQAPVQELALLRVPASRVYIVENLQTALALDDIPNSVAFMGLGYRVDVLGILPWVPQTQATYWGDIDTHGFAILNRARMHLPNLTSTLMDEDTLMRHRLLWVEEKEQNAANELPLLTPEEQEIYRHLKRQRWGSNVRLEQERIPWDYAWEALQRASVDCSA